jgi:hypothetical protein
MYSMRHSRHWLINTTLTTIARTISLDKRGHLQFSWGPKKWSLSGTPLLLFEFRIYHAVIIFRLQYAGMYGPATKLEFEQRTLQRYDHPSFLYFLVLLLPYSIHAVLCHSSVSFLTD